MIDNDIIGLHTSKRFCSYDGRVGARSWAILVVGLCVGWAGRLLKKRLQVAGSLQQRTCQDCVLIDVIIITAVILLLLFPVISS